jgi:hypothetical protein
MASSLLRFALKTAKNRLKGDFLPCKLPKEPMNCGFFGTKYRKNLQAQQAPREPRAITGKSEIRAHFFGPGPKKPGFPLQFLGIVSQFLRDFRFNPLRGAGNLTVGLWFRAG